MVTNMRIANNVKADSIELNPLATHDITYLSGLGTPLGPSSCHSSSEKSHSAAIARKAFAN